MELLHLPFSCLSRCMEPPAGRAWPLLAVLGCVPDCWHWLVCAARIMQASGKESLLSVSRAQLILCKDTELPDACQVHNGSYAGADARVMVL